MRLKMCLLLLCLSMSDIWAIAQDSTGRISPQPETTAVAGSYPLELKKLPTHSGRMGADEDTLYILNHHEPQSLSIDGDQVEYRKAGVPEFSSIARHEPGSYRCKHPFRGVFRLGSDDYAFVLDSEALKAQGYHLLYFDLNHNGDLTDDGIITADPLDSSPTSIMLGLSLVKHRMFPTVDLQINIDGDEVDYSIVLQVISQSISEDFFYAQVHLFPGACREGQVTIEGRSRKITLFDSNSNGRYDDHFQVQDEGDETAGGMKKIPGDILLLDSEEMVKGIPNTGVSGFHGQHPLSKIICIDDRFYDVKVSPSGDRIFLSPSSLPLGYVANPNEGFTAVLHSDMGTVKIKGGGEEVCSLPAGEWQLLEYLIDKSDPKVHESRPKIKKGFYSTALMKPFTYVLAENTQGCAKVDVRRGKATLLPFGPPYKGLVKVSGKSGSTVHLDLDIIGTAGEMVKEFSVKGKKPKEPVLVIAKLNGEKVERGRFRYG